MKKYIILAFSAVALTSCNDFLQQEPLDFGNENSYYNKQADIEVAVNKFYEFLPVNQNLWGGMYSQDTNSDTQVESGFNQLFYRGDKKTVKIDETDWNKITTPVESRCQWNFSRLRAINFCINKTESRYDEIIGQREMIDHYLGEAYFFRALEYFRLLRSYGDVPILKETFSEDRDYLAQMSVRQPRNEVARFILEDLDHAIELMLDMPPVSGRVADDVAYALKSRVALYEGTWEKYHAGTCFVPGNSKWPGAAKHSGFTFKSGSAENEVNFFLEEAYKSAELAIANHTLEPDSASYFKMFNSATPFDANGEVILARYYMTGVLSHSTSAYLKAGGGCGVTRQAVSSFLMKSGKPIYADAKYKGDKTSYHELLDRDIRLSGAVRPAGLITGRNASDIIYEYRPYIYNYGRERATTGYELQKWYSTDPAQNVQSECTTSVPLFRAGEAMLNYIEAYYERHGSLNDKCDDYWRQLRRRADVDEDYNATIAATNLDKEMNLAVYSRGQKVNTTLYNIRRERMCELLAEGLRLDDLKRWRSLDSMVDYQPEGFNLWDEMYKLYSASNIAPEVVSQKNISKYLRPLQINATSVVYNGYNFPKPHYLEPIPISEFLMTGDALYQNPGWPNRIDGTADYSYDCD